MICVAVYDAGCGVLGGVACGLSTPLRKVTQIETPHLICTERPPSWYVEACRAHSHAARLRFGQGGEELNFSASDKYIHE